MLFCFVCREGYVEEGDDADSLDDGGSLSLGDHDLYGIGNSSSEESQSGPDILQQRRGKKRVLSESPIKAPDHCENFFGKKSKERYRTGIAHIKMFLFSIKFSSLNFLV